MEELGRVLISLGLLLLILGGVIYLAGGSFGWLGKLPGDIRIERENFVFYFPLTTMLLISLIINLLLRLFK